MNRLWFLLLLTVLCLIRLRLGHFAGAFCKNRNAAAPHAAIQGVLRLCPGKNQP